MFFRKTVKYVQRKVTATPDFTLASPFIADGALYPDQLDLSLIVPSGAKAVILSFIMNGSVPGQTCFLYANQTTMIGNVVYIKVDTGYTQGPVILALDDVANDRLVDVLCVLTCTQMDVFVQGYFI